jgi:hypothetical protein
MVGRGCEAGCVIGATLSVAGRASSSRGMGSLLDVQVSRAVATAGKGPPRSATPSVKAAGHPQRQLNQKAAADQD